MLRPQGDVASSRKAPRPQHRATRSLAPPDPVIAPPAGLAARGRGRGAFLPRDSGAWLVPAQTCGQQIRGGRPRVPRERLSVTRPTSGGGGGGASPAARRRRPPARPEAWVRPEDRRRWRPRGAGMRGRRAGAGAYPVGRDAVLQGQHGVHAPPHVFPGLGLLLPGLLLDPAGGGGRRG